MKKFLALYLTPASVLDNWKATPEEQRKEEEAKMQADWKAWMEKNGSYILETAGAGATKRVTKDGTVDIKNDVMLYSLVEAESHEEAAKIFVGHPHFGIPEASIEIMVANVLPGMKDF